MSVATTTTLGTFVFAKDCPIAGKKLGDEIQMAPDAAAKFVTDGYLTEKSAKVETNAAEQLATLIGTTVETALTKAISTVNNQAKANGRINLSVPAKAYGEAREDESLGEWLQSMSYAASPQHPMYQKSIDRIVNKYHSRRNPDFHAEWQQGNDFAQAVMKAQGVPQDVIDKASAQSETVGALGGFAVPIQFYPEIIKLAGEKSMMLDGVRKYSMTGLQMNIPAIDYSKGGSGASPYLGGMVAGWLQDGQTFPQTNMSMREIILKANILCGYTVANRTLLADNQVGLQEVLTELMGETIGFYVDYAIINGTGVNQPQGILNSAAAISVTRTGSANGAILTDVATNFQHLHPEGYPNSFWLISPSVNGTLVTMNDASGRVVMLPIMPGMDGGPASRNLPYLILGRPARVSQLASALATKGDLILIDPTQYAFGMRQEIELGVSEHVNFLSNQLTYRFLFRGDGQSRINTYLTLANGDTVSPFTYRAT